MRSLFVHSILILLLLIFSVQVGVSATKKEDSTPKENQTLDEILPQTILAPPELMQEARELYFNRKQKEALDIYLQVSKKTHERDAFLNAVFIALELGDTNLAVDTITVALKYYPQDTTILEFAAEAYLVSGYNVNAENMFSRLTENNDKTEFYYIGLARAQMGMGEYDLAEHNLKEASKGKTLLPLSNFMLGELYTKQKQYDKAAVHYKKAVDLDSQFLEAQKNYGDTLFKLKKYSEAWARYKNVQAVDKHNKDVASALEDLKKMYTPPVNVLELPERTRAHTSIKKPISYLGKTLPLIRVGLGAKINGAPLGVKEVEFSTSHPFTAIDKKGKVLIKNGTKKQFWKAVLSSGKSYLVSPKGDKTAFNGSIKIMQKSTRNNSHTTIIKKMLVGHGTTWISREDKEYRGDIEIINSSRAGGLYLVNHLNLEEYVFGVVASEMPSKFPIEALKVQAVIARTYAMKFLGKHKEWGYDVCDTQNCQVYGGVKAERERSNSATEGTQGLIVAYKNKPIEAVFSSNCGGYTQSAKEAGWWETPYLKPVSDYKDFDESNLQPYHFRQLLQQQQDAYSKYFKNVSQSNFRWTRYIEEPTLRRIVAGKKNIGKIKAIIPLGRGRSGYVSGVRIVGSSGTLTLTKENEIKKYLATGLLRSTYFIVEPSYEKGQLKAFVFYGGGWGHGVGLCQTGTGGRAEAGQNFKDILMHYYSDTKIKDVR